MNAKSLCIFCTLFAFVLIINSELAEAAPLNPFRFFKANIKSGANADPAKIAKAAENANKKKVTHLVDSKGGIQTDMLGNPAKKMSPAKVVAGILLTGAAAGVAPHLAFNYVDKKKAEEQNAAASSTETVDDGSSGESSSSSLDDQDSTRLYSGLNPCELTNIYQMDQQTLAQLGCSTGTGAAGGNANMQQQYAPNANMQQQYAPNANMQQQQQNGQINLQSGAYSMNRPVIVDYTTRLRGDASVDSTSNNNNQDLTDAQNLINQRQPGSLAGHIHNYPTYIGTPYTNNNAGAVANNLGTSQQQLQA